MVEIVQHFKILDQDNKKNIGETLKNSTNNRDRLAMMDGNMKKMLKECLELENMKKKLDGEKARTDTVEENTR
jgi:hypothetical protein